MDFRAQVSLRSQPHRHGADVAPCTQVLSVSSIPVSTPTLAGRSTQRENSALESTHGTGHGTHINLSSKNLKYPVSLAAQ